MVMYNGSYGNVLLVVMVMYYGSYCYGRWWKKVRTKVQRGTCSSLFMNLTLNEKTTKENERNSSVWYRIQKQKTTTHKHRREQATYEWFTIRDND